MAFFNESILVSFVLLICMVGVIEMQNCSYFNVTNALTNIEDIKKNEGFWYTLVKNNNETKNCLRFNLKFVGDHDVIIQYKQGDITLANITGPIAQNGTFTQTFRNETSTYMFLKTNDANFTILYSCQNNVTSQNNITSKRKIWVLGRQNNITENQRIELFAILDKLSINPNSMVKLEQNDTICQKQTNPIMKPQNYGPSSLPPNKTTNNTMKPQNYGPSSLPPNKTNVALNVCINLKLLVFAFICFYVCN